MTFCGPSSTTSAPSAGRPDRPSARCSTGHASRPPALRRTPWRRRCRPAGPRSARSSCGGCRRTGPSPCPGWCTRSPSRRRRRRNRSARSAAPCCRRRAPRSGTRTRAAGPRRPLRPGAEHDPAARLVVDHAADVGVPAAEVPGDLPALPRLEPGGHEPGGDARPGGDGRPDLFGGGVQLDRLLQLAARSLPLLSIDGVHREDHPVRPSAGRGLVVVLGDQRGDRGRRAPRRTRPGRPPRRTAPLRRWRRSPPACRPRVAPAMQRPDLVDQPGRDAPSATGRTAGPASAAGSGRDRGQRRRRDHVGGRGRPHDPLGHVALPALLDELDQPVPLQRPQVVVHLLPGQPDPAPPAWSPSRARPARPAAGPGSGPATPPPPPRPRSPRRPACHEPATDNFVCQAGACRCRRRAC